MMSLELDKGILLAINVLIGLEISFARNGRPELEEETSPCAIAKVEVQRANLNRDWKRMLER
jgi:hypothetical protein